MERWSDQTAIVTGASSGIGAALAQALSRRGARVALAARRLPRLEAVAAGCPTETLAVPCDVTVPEQRRLLVDRVVERWGRIDVLVNNAGLGLYGTLEDTQEDQLRRLLEVNLIAVYGMIRLVLPIMKAADRGLILNIASTGGLIAHAPKVSAYLASKHAVVGMSRGLRLELQGGPVRVQVVCPHLTDTEFFAVGIGAEEMSEAADAVRHRMDSPDEVAEGTLEQLPDGPFLLFPTARAKAAYARLREAP
jgi:short-subunit dehydrogenase